MAGVGLVEWPLAAIIVAGHLISENSNLARRLERRRRR